MRSWLEPAVELRLGKVRGSLAKDFVGLAKLAVFAFLSLEFRRHIRRHTGSLATVALGLLLPLMQHLRRAADLAEQTTRVVLAAEAYKRFRPIGEKDLFDMEYWSLEQGKARKA